MANHGYITTKKHLTTELLTAALNKISRERFGGKIRVEGPFPDAEDNWGHGTHLVHVAEGVSYPVWLSSHRKIEICHGPGTIVYWWVETVIINDLAVAFNGDISDDGVGRMGKGEPGKYPTFTSYLDAMRISKPMRQYHLSDARELCPNLKEWFGV